MDTKLIISAQVPRHAKDFKNQIPFNHGLVPYFFFGGLFMLFAIIPTVTLLISGGIHFINPLPLIVSLLLFEALGILIVYIGIRKRKNRITTFEQGVAVSGEVIKQGRKFVFWKSWRDYIVKVKYEIGEGKYKECTLCSSQNNFHTQMPLNSKHIGFWAVETGSAFFPIELGVLFEMK